MYVRSPGGNAGLSASDFGYLDRVLELRMREFPSIIPWGELDRTVYLVLDDFGGKYGWAWWPKTNVADTERATLIRRLLEGRYSSPVRIVAFNTAEGWSRDVSDEIAAERWRTLPCLRLSMHDMISHIPRGSSRRWLRRHRSCARWTEVPLRRHCRG